MNIDWSITAEWAQAITSTIVLFMIYFQMRQTNNQLLQDEVHERFRRSWEFVRLYREELRPEEEKLGGFRDGFDARNSKTDSPAYKAFMDHFFNPRIHLFVLLNQLVQHQEVDERVLFGYLGDEFNQFVEIGVTKYGLAEFRQVVGTKISLLLTLWGSQIKANQLLIAAT